MDFVPSLPTLLAFAAASLLLAATPGPDMTLSISRALAQGKKAALLVVLGTGLGIVVHTLLVAFGISALITASPTAFLALKTGGRRLSSMAGDPGNPLWIEPFGDEDDGCEGKRVFECRDRILGQHSEPEGGDLLHDVPAAVRQGR